MKSFVFILIFIGVFAYSPHLAASDTGYFVRLRSIDKLESGQLYLLIAPISQAGYLLTNTAKGTKLEGIYIDKLSDTLSAEIPASAVWQLDKLNKSWTLKSFKNKMWLSSGKSVTDLKMSSSNPLQWNISYMNNFFLLDSNVKDVTRRLSFDSDYLYFGNYIPSNNYTPLWIYLYVTTQKGENPEIKKQVLAAEQEETLWALSTSQTLSNITDLQLSDSTIAPVKSDYQWMCVPHDSNYYDIRSISGLYLLPDTKGGLTTDLRNEKEFRWHYQNGCFTAKGMSGTEGILGLSSDETKHPGIFAKDSGEETFHVLRFYPIAKERDSIETEQGTKILYGGWSKKKLACVLLDGVTGLDLTHIALPLHCDSFAHQEKESNLLIYIEKNAQPFISDLWEKVIVCDTLSGENKAVTLIKLTDKAPFYTVYPFYVGNDTLTYSRKLYNDNGWETLYIPFDTEIEEVETEQLLSRDGDELSFEEVRKVEAYTPLLFRSTSDSLKAVASAQLIYPETKPETLLKGTLRKVTNSNDGSSLYMLEQTGRKFVKTKKDSYLEPFRSYIEDHNREEFRITHNVSPASLYKATLQKDKKDIYTLQGICIHKAMDELPRGIYIINGRKKIIE